MPKIDIASLPVDNRTNYPEPFNRVVAGRSRKRLGNAAGLDQFGVNLTTLKPGAAAGFKANVPNGHHLVNKSSRDAVFLEIGTRSKHERAEYPDVDLLVIRDGAGGRYTHRDGQPYPK